MEPATDTADDGDDDGVRYRSSSAKATAVTRSAQSQLTIIRGCKRTITVHGVSS